MTLVVHLYISSYKCNCVWRYIYLQALFTLSVDNLQTHTLNKKTDQTINISEKLQYAQLHTGQF